MARLHLVGLPVTSAAQQSVTGASARIGLGRVGALAPAGARDTPAALGRLEQLRILLFQLIDLILKIE